MRKGAFEEREGAGGERFYRLTWEAKQNSLSPKEVLAGLFIRYLISRGKLSEFTAVPDANSSAGDRPKCERRKRVVRRPEIDPDV